MSSSAKFGTKSGSTLTQNGVTWTATSTDGEIQNSYSTSYKGQQFGTAKTVWVGNFSTSDIAGKIKKVEITANTGESADLSVKVGTTDFTSSTATSVAVEKNTSGINTYTFSGDAEGKIVVSLTGTSKACYLGSITVTYTEDTKIITTLTFPKTSYIFTIGENEGILEISDNPAKLSPSDAGTINYKSDNEDVATVDDKGVVTLLTEKPAEVTITASYAGNDTYRASSASYTIVVKALEEVFDFSKPEDYGYEKATSNGISMPVGAEVKAGNVTLKVLKKGTSDASWWNDGVWRIYKNSEHELSVPGGYMITSVTIVSTTNSYAKYKIQGGALGNNWSGASLKVNIVNDPSANSRIKTITVTYAKIESLTTAASGFSTYAADYAVNYTEAGLQAYAVKVSDDKTKVAYAECTGVVPAGKAVLVKGTASTSYSLTPATEDADATFDTDLQISDGNVTADGSTIFAFGTKNGVSGFKIVKSGVVIPEKKGYLVVANASAAKDFFAFEDSTNGIDDPTIGIGEEEVPLFNLAGQRVGKDYKGIVVKNGKKYVNK